MIRTAILAGSALALTAGVALAVTAGATFAPKSAQILPIKGLSIELGEVRGIAYYTVEEKGFRVVATLAGQDGGTPVRFIATLVDGQSMTVSVPRGVGQPEIATVFVRNGDALTMSTSDAVVQ